MAKWILLVLLLPILSTCSPFGGGRPSNLNDACSVVDNNPGWERHMQATQRKWGVPVSVQMAIIWQESKFVADARPPRKRVLGFIPWGRETSAYGYAQIIDGTWEDYKDANDRFIASRDNFGDATDFIGWYADRSTKLLGIRKSNVRDQYLAYHEGHAGYRRGSYRNKAWLVEVANNLVSRERMYATQLRSCA